MTYLIYLWSLRNQLFFGFKERHTSQNFKWAFANYDRSGSKARQPQTRHIHDFIVTQLDRHQGFLWDALHISLFAYCTNDPNIVNFFYIAYFIIWKKKFI